jgi:4-hydroxybenzoate polyprenyltransferase
MNTLWYIFVSMRPRQWTKNLMLFAGIVFSERFHEPTLVKKSIVGCILFCFFSGAVYILNDVFDRNKDREHPAKKDRPITGGRLGTAAASTVSAVLIVALLPVSWMLGGEFFIMSLVFILINLAYSMFLRGIVILDVITISFSFLIRAAAGVAVLHVDAPDVELSPWLLICTLFLSLFLAFCKRRYEVCSLESAHNHRNALKDYSVRFLDQLVVMSATAAVISYSIYTVWPKTVDKFGTSNLVYTIPFVVFGIMRYLYLVYTKQEGGDPSGVLLLEKAILIDVFLWFCATILILVRA